MGGFTTGERKRARERGLDAEELLATMPDP
jgi:hypothetical protein